MYLYIEFVERKFYIQFLTFQNVFLYCVVTNAIVFINYFRNLICIGIIYCIIVQDYFKEEINEEMR